MGALARVTRTGGPVFRVTVFGGHPDELPRLGVVQASVKVALTITPEALNQIDATDCFRWERHERGCVDSALFSCCLNRGECARGR